MLRTALRCAVAFQGSRQLLNRVSGGFLRHSSSARARSFVSLGAAAAVGVGSIAIAFADETSNEKLASQAEALYGGHPLRVYELLKPAVDSADENTQDKAFAEVLWRFARSCHDIAMESADQAAKKDLTFQGYAAAEKAVALNDDSFGAHKWMAIMISDVGDFEGLKAKLLKSYKMKDHFMRAIELNPSDATSHHLLGIWCFTFADLPWYQRQAASAVFASPPSSTYDEALSHFERAEQTDPGFYTKNALYLGKTYRRMGDKEKAKQWLETCLAMQARNADDRQAHEDAAKELKQI